MHNSELLLEKYITEIGLSWNSGLYRKICYIGRYRLENLIDNSLQNTIECVTICNAADEGYSPSIVSPKSFRNFMRTGSEYYFLPSLFFYSKS